MKLTNPPRLRGTAVTVITGPDAGKTATIIQEPLKGSPLYTIKFSNNRAIIIAESALQFIGEDNNDHAGISSAPSAPPPTCSL